MPQPETEVSAEQDPFENVVTFGRKGEGGGRPYAPPPEPLPTPREEVKAGAVDEMAIRHLEAMLESFRAGEYVGLVLVAGTVDRETGNQVGYIARITDFAYDYAYSFAGCVEDVKITILDSATHAEPEEDDLEEFDEYED